MPLAGLSSPVIETGFRQGYVLAFCIAINCFLKYAAKLEGIFRAFVKAAKQLEDTTGATRGHLPKTWESPHFLYIPLQ
jgi:hypothetical protein